MYKEILNSIITLIQAIIVSMAFVLDKIELNKFFLNGRQAIKDAAHKLKSSVFF